MTYKTYKRNIISAAQLDGEKKEARFTNHKNMIMVCPFI